MRQLLRTLSILFCKNQCKNSKMRYNVCVIPVKTGIQARVRGVVIATLFLLAGCTVGPDFKRPDSELPRDFGVAQAPTVEAAMPERISWRRSMGGFPKLEARRLTRAGLA